MKEDRNKKPVPGSFAYLQQMQTTPLPQHQEKPESPAITTDTEKNPPTRVVPEEKPVMVVEQEIRMTLPLPESSVALLDQIERTIFTKRDIKHRSRKRLTKNNVARSWLSLLREISVDWSNIRDDADLTERLRKAIRDKGMNV